MGEFSGGDGLIIAEFAGSVILKGGGFIERCGTGRQGKSGAAQGTGWREFRISPAEGKKSVRNADRFSGQEQGPEDRGTY